MRRLVVADEPVDLVDQHDVDLAGPEQDEPVASTDRQPMGCSIQLLHQRSPVGPDVRPHLPFSARVCLNQHHWLANQMREDGIDFKQCANAFTGCSASERLQQLADSLTPWDLLTCDIAHRACLIYIFYIYQTMGDVE
jgi:hypothetical protein